MYTIFDNSTSTSRRNHFDEHKVIFNYDKIIRT